MNYLIELNNILQSLGKAKEAATTTAVHFMNLAMNCTKTYNDAKFRYAYFSQLQQETEQDMSEDAAEIRHLLAKLRDIDHVFAYMAFNQKVVVEFENYIQFDKMDEDYIDTIGEAIDEDLIEKMQDALRNYDSALENDVPALSNTDKSVPPEALEIISRMVESITTFNQLKLRLADVVSGCIHIFQEAQFVTQQLEPAFSRICDDVEFRNFYQQYNEKINLRELAKRLSDADQTITLLETNAAFIEAVLLAKIKQLINPAGEHFKIEHIKHMDYVLRFAELRYTSVDCELTTQSLKRPLESTSVVAVESALFSPGSKKCRIAVDNQEAANFSPA